MVVDNKATVTYVQLLKEDLVILRIVPITNYRKKEFDAIISRKLLGRLNLKIRSN